MTNCDAESTPLPDGVVLVSFVCCEFIAIGVEHHALFEAIGMTSLKQPGVVVVWNEADFL